MKQTYENAIKIINGSKIFSFDGPVLEIKSYRTGESVKLDLSKLTPEMFEELKKEEPRRAVWLRCKENIDARKISKAGTKGRAGRWALSTGTEARFCRPTQDSPTR